MEHVAVAGSRGFTSAMRISGIHPYGKLTAVRHGLRGSGLRIPHYFNLLAETDLLGGRHCDARITVGANRRSCRLPARLRSSETFLAFLGYYVAEGNAQANYVIISNHHPVIRRSIERALKELGLPYRVRPSSRLRRRIIGASIPLGQTVRTSGRAQTSAGVLAGPIRQVIRCPIKSVFRR